MDYPNVPKALGVAMTYASLRDLDDFYSLQDMYDILEKHAVDAHNTKRINKLKARQR